MALKLLVAGATEVTRQVLRRLGDLWDATVVDPSGDRLDRLRGDRPFEKVVGDPTSRIVLQRAGMEHADAVVAATDDDELNVEICKLARDARVARISAVVVDPDRTGVYRDLGITAWSPAELAARQIELRLETRRVASKAFAGGRVEAIDIQVGPDSPVRGARIEDLNGPQRIVAAVLRGGELLIPSNGEIALEAEDIVTIVAAAAELPAVVKTFTARTPRFPLDFGKRVAVSLGGDTDLGHLVTEAITITAASQATSLMLVYPEVEGDEEDPIHALLEGANYAAEGIEIRNRPTADRPWKTLWTLAAEESVGLVVVSMPGQAGLAARIRAWRSISRARRLSTPILFARGKGSYERILVAARRTPAGRAAARAAIDLAAGAGAKLATLAVVDPEFVAGAGGKEEARLAVEQVKVEAASQRIDVEAVAGEGNPVHAFGRAAQDCDLVVLGVSSDASFLRSDIAPRLVGKTDASILIVPARQI